MNLFNQLEVNKIFRMADELKSIAARIRNAAHNRKLHFKDIVDHLKLAKDELTQFLLDVDKPFKEMSLLVDKLIPKAVTREEYLKVVNDAIIKRLSMNPSQSWTTSGLSNTLPFTDAIYLSASSLKQNYLPIIIKRRGNHRFSAARHYNAVTKKWQYNKAPINWP